VSWLVARRKKGIFLKDGIGRLKGVSKRQQQVKELRASSAGMGELEEARTEIP